MKIIELLNKIANGEEVPEKIKYENDIYILTDNYCYYCDETNLILSDRLYAEQSRLNEKVEILEEEKKIPEKLKWNEKSQHNVVTDNTKKTLEHLLSRSEQLKKSINEIIDYLKSKGE